VRAGRTISCPFLTKAELAYIDAELPDDAVIRRNLFLSVEPEPWRMARDRYERDVSANAANGVERGMWARHTLCDGGALVVVMHAWSPGCRLTVFLCRNHHLVVVSAHNDKRCLRVHNRATHQWYDASMNDFRPPMSGVMLAERAAPWRFPQLEVYFAGKHLLFRGSLRFMHDACSEVWEFSDHWTSVWVAEC